MTKATSTSTTLPAPGTTDLEVAAFRASFDERSPVDELVRHGAQQMLQAAIDTEIDQFLLEHSGRIDEQGRRYVARNGSLPPRRVMTGAGGLEIQ